MLDPLTSAEVLVTVVVLVSLLLVVEVNPLGSSVAGCDVVVPGWCGSRMIWGYGVE